MCDSARPGFQGSAQARVGRGYADLRLLPATSTHCPCTDYICMYILDTYLQVYMPVPSKPAPPPSRPNNAADSHRLVSASCTYSVSSHRVSDHFRMVLAWPGNCNRRLRAPGGSQMQAACTSATLPRRAGAVTQVSVRARRSLALAKETVDMTIDAMPRERLRKAHCFGKEELNTFNSMTAAGGISAKTETRQLELRIRTQEVLIVSGGLSTPLAMLAM